MVSTSWLCQRVRLGSLVLSLAFALALGACSSDPHVRFDAATGSGGSGGGSADAGRDGDAATDRGATSADTADRGGNPDLGVETIADGGAPADAVGADVAADLGGGGNPDGGTGADAADGGGTIAAYTCTTAAGAAGVTLSSAGLSAPMVVSSQDFPGVARVAGLLQADIGRVTAATPPTLAADTVPGAREIVLIGTLGKSPLIDGLVQAGKLDVADVTGHWETFVRQAVDNPFPGVDRALVIAGSDKRGTIYGALDLSAEIGVSPWTYWADVPVAQKSDLCIAAARHRQGDPAVKYRGIFLNDEAPALSGWAYAKFGGFNTAFYDKVFELLSRLRANYLWPAMWANAFADDDPQNQQRADEWGIVMGTSHHEPMTRAQQEWARHGTGAWDYTTNAANLQAFWSAGITRMGTYENVVTIGMRGDGDVALSPQTNIDLLEQIVSDQRGILASVTGKNPATIPQAWVLYKEVQDYYDQGMQVPDDVTLVFSDDNWGNVRKLPKIGDPARGGGYGMYYHFDYVGGPRSYKWLNTNPIPRVWEQMNLAYRHGVDRIWVVNVGDLKPMELPTQFFLDFAFNPNAIPAEKVADWTRAWAAQQFGADNAAAVADLLTKYTKYNGRRKPELLDADTYSITDYLEAETIVADYNRLAVDADRLYQALPNAYKDAFFELVLYPVRACANLNDLYVTVAKNRLYGTQGRVTTNDMAARASTLFANDATLSSTYNQTVAGGKWPHMMDQTHIGYTSWDQPAVNTMPTVSVVQAPAVADMGVAIEGSRNWWPQTTTDAVLPEQSPFRRQAPPYIEVFNRGTVAFDFTVESSVPWLTVTPALGTVVKELRLTPTVDWTQAPIGTQRVPITIHGPNGATVVVQAPVRYPASPAPAEVIGFVESNGVVSIEAEHFARAVNAAPVSWQRIPDLGRTLSGMTPFPPTAPNRAPGGRSPHLEYDVYMFTGGSVNVRADVSPTQNFHSPDGLRYAVSFDDQTPQIVNLHTDTSEPTWEGWVSNNIIRTTTRHTLGSTGQHVLKYWMVDAGVVLQKLIVDTGGMRPSYLGPPESLLGAASGGTGAGGADGGSGGTGGAGGSSGAGGAPADAGVVETCPGCARLAVPFVADNTATFFQINLPAPIDMTGASATFRVCIAAGVGSEVLQPFVQNGAAQGYSGRFPFTTFAAVASCDVGFTDYVVDAGETATFVPSAVTTLGLKVAVPTGLTGYSNPTVVYVDSITISNAVAGPFTYDTPSAVNLVVNAFNAPVAGSAVTWLGP